MAKQKAPGTLEIVQDFANTLDLDVDAPGDELTNPKALRAWLADRELMDRRAPVSERDLRRAVELRAAIRAVLSAHAGESMDPGALSALSEAAAEAGLAPVFAADSVALEPRAAGALGGLGKIVGYIVDAVAQGTWVRLKACCNEDCRWVYYDSARNRSARWCSMAVCGNRMKARAFRARQAGEGSG